MASGDCSGLVGNLTTKACGLPLVTVTTPLGRTLRDEVGLNSLKPGRNDHMLFTVSGHRRRPAQFGGV
jgi:hypothetical protein